ncbi:universal stress protein [Microbacterium sp. LRZ72]|uniref:universal stress protein n=1 Tax=Microbacterium sp. LRZ72 TaxID=2942481 RepID=UPI0029B1F610|nr:universal stress protein [Microbacterium sp. LRZ72]MDX2377991.1 universal stress protein [Microbacterium sp. LRZ72]
MTNNTIVVGVTDAAAARRALDWAITRARQRRQKLLLVSVVGGAVGAVGEGYVVHHALEATERMLADDAARATEAGIEVETRVGRGNPIDQLIAASEGAELLVIGSDYRGTGGPVRGNRGIRIAAGAHCPVVAIPDVAYDERSGIVVGVDGSELSEAAVAFAAAEADRLGEPLIAVSVWTPLVVPLGTGAYPEDYLKNMQTLTEESQALALAGLRQDYPDLDIRTVVVSGYPAAEIARVGKKATLVVVGSRGRGPVARFLLGSVSQEVLTHLPTATAVVR